MSYSRVTIYKRDGSFLGTIDTQTKRSWTLSDFGKCEFELSLRAAKAARKYLQFGNLIYVEHEKLPAWGGKIMPEMQWSSDDTIKVAAFSGEALLKLRRSPWQQTWSMSSAGALFRRIVAEANKVEDLLIRAGTIWEGGGDAQDTMDAKSLYDHAAALGENRGNDWNLDAEFDSNTGKPYWSAGYWQKRGEMREVWLIEGSNIERRGTPLTMQRWMLNDLMGIGDGADGARPVAYAYDTDSIATYGLMQGSEDFDGNSNPATLQNNTRGKLGETKNPRNTFKLTAIDRGDIFRALRLGNTLRLKTLTFGWNGQEDVGMETRARILAMRYEDETNRCDLTVDEVTA